MVASLFCLLAQTALLLYIFYFISQHFYRSGLFQHHGRVFPFSTTDRDLFPYHGQVKTASFIFFIKDSYFSQCAFNFSTMDRYHNSLFLFQHHGSCCSIILFPQHIDRYYSGLFRFQHHEHMPQRPWPFSAPQTDYSISIFQ